MTTISVASRQSPLAIAQVEEVLNDLKNHHHYVDFSSTYIEISSDKPSVTSRRSVDKIDFTKEIDEQVLSKACRVAVYSAKDLPEPLPEGLSLAALTQGIDPSDSLVLKQGQNLSTLPHQPIIAVSSKRREEGVKIILPEAHFTEAHGTIHQRLELLSLHSIDGVVIAESALIRLNLTHLNRIQLPGPTIPLKGQLAVIARTDDEEMLFLFSSIDCRQLVPTLSPILVH